MFHAQENTERTPLCRFDDVRIHRCGGEELHDGLLPVGQASSPSLLNILCSLPYMMMDLYSGVRYFHAA